MIIYYPADHGEPNIYAVKAIFPDVDTGLRGAEARKERKSSSAASSVEYRDPRLSVRHMNQISKQGVTTATETHPTELPMVDGKPILLTKARNGDSCPNCQDGKLKLQQAVEIGHTFHLGTRYSIPLEAQVLDANGKKVAIEMGCHGIGVSRLIGAIASLLADSKGLNWPLAIAPFDVMLVGAGKVGASDIETFYDMMSSKLDSCRKLDVAMDDRDRPIGWKLNDADLIGYPFVIVLGNDWVNKQVVELQCRRLGFKAKVPATDLTRWINQCIERLEGGERSFAW